MKQVGQISNIDGWNWARIREALDALEDVDEGKWSSADKVRFANAFGYLLRIQSHLASAGAVPTTTTKQKDNDNNDNDSSEIHGFVLSGQAPVTT